MKAWELLAKPNGWTQGVARRNALGGEVHSYDDTACQFCLVGALDKVYGNYGWTVDGPRVDAANKVSKALSKLTGLKIPSPASWNDAPGRTQDEVVSFLKELDL